MKLYFISVKSHCNFPDYEAEILAKPETKAVDYFYKQLKGEYDKKFIKENMGFEELIEVK